MTREKGVGVLQEATGGGRKAVVFNRHFPRMQSIPGFLRSGSPSRMLCGWGGLPPTAHG